MLCANRECIEHGHAAVAGLCVGICLDAWWAASALDSGRRADLETGMVKLYASEVCIKALLEAMRIHGGYEMKATGLFGMTVPEEYGSIAIDAVSYSVVFEEISKAWMGVAGILGSHSLAISTSAHANSGNAGLQFLGTYAAYG